MQRFKPFQASLLALALLAGTGLSACQSPQPLVSLVDLPRLAPQPQPLQQATDSQPKQLFAVADAGGSIQLQLRLQAKPAEGFRLAACNVNAHLDHLKIYLIDGSSSLGTVLLGALGILQLAHGPYTVSKKSLVSPSGSESFRINHVPEGKYYVAMSAHRSNGDNITGATLGATGTVGGQLVAVSNGGGNASAPGRVEVGPAPTYAILNGTQNTLTLNLQLAGLLACL